jgi:hypothetical protein
LQGVDTHFVSAARVGRLKEDTHFSVWRNISFLRLGLFTVYGTRGLLRAMSMGSILVLLRRTRAAGVMGKKIESNIRLSDHFCSLCSRVLADEPTIHNSPHLDASAQLTNSIPDATSPSPSTAFFASAISNHETHRAPSRPRPRAASPAPWYHAHTE